GLVFTIENRALRPGSDLYLVTAPDGRAIAGNVGALAPGVIATLGWSETAYRRLDDQDTSNHRALVRVTELGGGFRLLIGRDLEERRRMFGIVAKAAMVDSGRDVSWHCRRHLRGATGAAPHRCHDWHHAADHDG